MKYKLKELMKTDVSKVYIMGVAIFCLLLLGGYFSYAMFTVNKEKNKAVSIVTGNLVYELKVNDNATNTITVEGNSSATYTINLNNTNNRDARLNFYYIGDLPSGVDAGYIVEEGTDTPPGEKGEVFSKAGSNGDKKVYKIKVVNSTGSSININLGVQIGLDYNDLSLPSNGHLFDEYIVTASDTIKDNIGGNGSINTSDPEQIFITGTNPNNYVWYSGKLWRVVSIDPSDNSMKLVTQWDISCIDAFYTDNQFSNSEVEIWLNDTRLDGFLGNLREPEKFIKMDSKWNATGIETNINNLSDIPKIEKTTIVEDPVGLLNMYEYKMACNNNSKSCYLNNGLYWWTLTPGPYGDYIISYTGSFFYDSSSAYGIRPVVNLKSDVKIASGSGTETDPYRLEGDNETPKSGTLINTRYSGEYIKFDSMLYRIVSHENGKGVKVVSNEDVVTSPYLKATSRLNNYFSGVSDTFLIVEDNTTWYVGETIGSTGGDYRLVKYKDKTMTTLTDNTEVSTYNMLRYGELMAGQFEKYDGDDDSNDFWVLSNSEIGGDGVAKIINSSASTSYTEEVNSTLYQNGVRAAFNLKENVIITGGDGTKNNPFTIDIG